MLEFKNTGRARVVNALDGRVIKCFSGPKAIQRFETECKVLTYLNRAGCPFVPRLLDSNRSRLSITTEYSGHNVERLSEGHLQELFDRLADYGVRHDDPALRNVLYNSRSNEFMLIDFELAEIVGDSAASVESTIERNLNNLDQMLENAI